jgi:hypothetical protein
MWRRVKWWLATKYRVTPEKHLLHCHFVFHESHVNWFRVETEDPWWEASSGTTLTRLISHNKYTNMAATLLKTVFALWRLALRNFAPTNFYNKAHTLSSAFHPNANSLVRNPFRTRTNTCKRKRKRTQRHPGKVKAKLSHEYVRSSGDIAPKFLTSALDRGEWSDSRPGCFVPEEIAPRYPMCRRLGGPQSRSGRYGEISCPYRESNPDLSFVKALA